MKTSLRIFLGSIGFLFAVVGAVALIAVLNTYRMYSLPLANTLVLAPLSAWVLVAGVWLVWVAMHNGLPRSPEEGFADLIKQTR